MPTLIIILASLAVLYLAGGFVCMNIATKRKKPLDYRIPSQAEKTKIPLFHEKVENAYAFIEQHREKLLEIRSDDGLALYADWLPNPNARATAVLVHGYASTPYNDFSTVIPHLYANGFSLLLPHHRAHGDSGGNRICFGALERLDVQKWVFLASELGGDKPILLHGLSMGAATVLMLSGMKLPDKVKAVVADCGFSSPADIMKYQIVQMTRLPLQFLMPSVALWTKLICGFNAYSASTVKAMQSNRLPVLFFHGEADTYVPPYMTRAAFDACNTPKQLVISPDAKHAQSFLINGAECEKALDAFINKYVLQET